MEGKDDDEWFWLSDDEWYCCNTKWIRQHFAHGSHLESESQAVVRQEKSQKVISTGKPITISIMRLPHPHPFLRPHSRV